MTQGIATTQNANTPAIIATATALAANPARIYWSIQNLSAFTLYVNLGGTASTSVFHYALKAGAGNDDGSGASIDSSGCPVFTGAITIAGTSPRYTVVEMAP